MFGIGGGNNMFSSIIGIAAQAALGVATGGASLLVTTAMKGVFMAMGDQILQQIGTKLGLPQGAVDIAQAAFHSAAGDPGGAVQNLQEAIGGFTGAIGGDAFDQGALQRAADDGVRNASDQFLQNIRENAQSEDGEGNDRRSQRGAAGGGSDSFLVAFAKALGKAIDSKMDRMMQVSKDIDKETQKANDSGGKRQAVIGEMSAELQGLGQEVGFLSQALANTVKSLGEATATLARKG